MDTHEGGYPYFFYEKSYFAKLWKFTFLYNMTILICVYIIHESEIKGLQFFSLFS